MSTTSTSNLIADYERAADDVAAAVKGMTQEQLMALPVPGKWSTLEVIAHLADSEIVHADRVKRTIAMEKPLLVGYDEVLYAKSLGYHERDAKDEVELFRLLRKQVARILRSLPADAWDRPSVHNERGLVTLRQHVEGGASHVAHHLRFVAEKRKALGV